MKQLQHEREAKPWTRWELGRQANIHPAEVGKFESGRTIPYPAQLKRLAKALSFEGDPTTLLDEVE